MQEDNLIEVKSISKKFVTNIKKSMFYGSIDILRNMVGLKYDTSNLRRGEFWSLKDISFTLKKGEALGIIGQNGAGKSTILRLINGIYPPDIGEINVRGKIGALIAVGAGFHPHLSGKENIYLNGSILGMSKKEIDEKYQQIVDFADIGDFLDAPVATYSSGMYVRLGFSIAIHSEPEILLADEVLAVGDLSFALKCYRKISEFREKGGSIILVSHGLQMVRNNCVKALWLDKGIVMGYGDVQEICDNYENFMIKKDQVQESSEESSGQVINNDPSVKFESVELLNDKTETNEFELGDTFKIRVKFNAQRNVKNPIFTLTIYNAENIAVISNHSNFDQFKPSDLKGQGYFDCLIENLNLKPSYYKCSITLSENEISNQIEHHEKKYRFQVLTNKDSISYGIYNPHPSWNLVN